MLALKIVTTGENGPNTTICEADSLLYQNFIATSYEEWAAQYRQTTCDYSVPSHILMEEPKESYFKTYVDSVGGDDIKTNWINYVAIKIIIGDGITKVVFVSNGTTVYIMQNGSTIDRIVL